jgi:hypothetical protein
MDCAPEEQEATGLEHLRVQADIVAVVLEAILWVEPQEWVIWERLALWLVWACLLVLCQE